jgi:hypothetical protein
MKAEFTDYLKSISLTEPFIKRITDIYEDYQTIFPLEMLDIFVSEYVKDDGNREYQGLWFFSDNYLEEAKEFLVKLNIDICPYVHCINYINFEYQDFNLKKAVDKSRLRIYFEFGNGKVGDMKASGVNCDYLIQIYRKFILPNLATEQ